MMPSLLLQRGRFAAFTMALLLAAGPAASATASDSLAENYAKWKANRPQSFAFTFVSTVYLCHSCAGENWRVEQNGDSVVRVTFLSPMDPGWEKQSYSIDTLFASIGKALDDGRRVEVDYDARLGFPEKTTRYPMPDPGYGSYTEYVSEFTDHTVSARIPARPSSGPAFAARARDITGRAVPRQGSARAFIAPR
jgi:hypothetical protein